MLITEEYRQQNAAMHAKGNYGISSSKWATDIDTMMTTMGAETLLDYGAGRGDLKKALEFQCRPAYAIKEYDPAILRLSELPQEPVDVVACTDVLEHIEPECLQGVIDHIASLSKRAAFLVVSTVKASKHLPDGRNAHLIIKPAWWWLRIFADHWRINLMREKPTEFYCICVPR